MRARGTAPRPLKGASAGGFTLIEVVVSIVFLSLLLMGTAGLDERRRRYADVTGKHVWGRSSSGEGRRAPQSAVRSRGARRGHAHGEHSTFGRVVSWNVVDDVDGELKRVDWSHVGRGNRPRERVPAPPGQPQPRMTISLRIFRPGPRGDAPAGLGPGGRGDRRCASSGGFASVRGFTLTEVVIAIALFGFMASAAFGFMMHQTRFYDTGERAQLVQQEARGAVRVIVDEIRRAGAASRPDRLRSRHRAPNDGSGSRDALRRSRHQARLGEPNVPRVPLARVTGNGRRRARTAWSRPRESGGLAVGDGVYIEDSNSVRAGAAGHEDPAAERRPRAHRARQRSTRSRLRGVELGALDHQRDTFRTERSRGMCGERSSRAATLGDAE